MVSTMISDAKGMLIHIKCKRLAEAVQVLKFQGTSASI
jgi:hypothetical protein